MTLFICKHKNGEQNQAGVFQDKASQHLRLFGNKTYLEFIVPLQQITLLR